MEKIINYLKQKYVLVNILFGAVFSLPVVLGGLFFTIVTGFTVAENGVIIFIALLSIYDLLYLLIFSIRKCPKIIFKIFFISNKNQINSAENIFYNNDYILIIDNIEYNLNKLDKLNKATLIKYSENIVYKKLICRLSIFLTLATFLAFGIF